MVDCVLEHMKDNWPKKKEKKRKSGLKEGKGRRKKWKSWGSSKENGIGKKLDSYARI
jgi:hypothetical protein